MKWFSKKEEPASVPRAASLWGLGDKEITTLYNTGKVVKLNAGDWLFREGDKDSTLFVVVTGALRVARPEGIPALETDIFQEGDVIGEVLFFRGAVRTVSVSSIESSSLLALDETAFKMLDSALQNVLLRKLNDQTTSRMNKITGICSNQRSQVDYLMSYIQNSMTMRSKDYEEADIIVNLCKSIPRLPVHTTNLIHLLSAGNASAREITALAKEDPSLVGEILKTVNSTYYSLNRQISDIQYAITFLGFNQVYQIVISNALKKSMPNTGEFKDVHDHSVIIADLAFHICQIHNRQAASTLSTIAVLHDIGKSVIFLLKNQNPKLRFFVEMLDPAIIGSFLLKGWNIPPKICGTIYYQYFPEFVPPSNIPVHYRQSVSLLYVAHAVYEYVGGEANSILQNPYLDEYLSFLNFKSMTIAELADQYVLKEIRTRIEIFPTHVRSFILNKKEWLSQKRIKTDQDLSFKSRYGNDMMIDRIDL